MMSVLTAPRDSCQLDIAERESTAAAPSQLDALAAAVKRWKMPTADVTVLADLLGEPDSTRSVAARQALRRPLMAARRVNIALDRLQAETSYAELLRAAPAELCWAGDFERVLYSRVEASCWFPTAWHAIPDAQGPDEKAFGEYVHGAQITLDSGMIEAEVVRRRVSALVSDTASEPRAFAPIVEIASSPAYVIAPVISGNTVVGLLHADTKMSGRPLSEADRVTLRAFADGVGLAMERVALIDRLDQQRAQIKSALTLAADVVDDLCASPVQLLCGQAVEPIVEGTRIGEQPDNGLTSREREVFALLVSGATNGEIADRLTVSETTVKSHVKHILRKLRVANRAEAISQHLMGNGWTGQR
jgi:DNA-binding CsgD family transcriptional regulator